jgi:hypothetical protein
MRDGEVPTQVKTPDDLREMADRARRLARAVLDQDAVSKLLEFARELEGRASAVKADGG